MSLLEKLNQFRKDTQDICKAIDQVCIIIRYKHFDLLKLFWKYGHESSFERTRREIQYQLAQAEKYRASILRNVTTFGSLRNLMNANIYFTLIPLYFSSWPEQ